MTVSICITAGNDENFIRGLLDDIAVQDYPHRLTELVFINNGSTDTTPTLLSSFARINKDFLRICIRSQEKSNDAYAFNTALSNAMGDIIILMDSRTRLESDFVSSCVAEIESGEDIVGGDLKYTSQSTSPWSGALAVAAGHMLGSSEFILGKKACKKEYLSTLSNAAYRREVFVRVGGFNENLNLFEVNEIQCRMRKAGYKLASCRSIHTKKYSVGSLAELMNKCYFDGVWSALASSLSHGCMPRKSFVPLIFIIALIAAAVTAATGKFLWMLLWGILYAIVGGIVAVEAMFYNGFNKTKLWFLAIFPIMHLCYGAGSLFGVIASVPWKLSRSHRANRKIRAVRCDVRNNTIG